MEKGDEKNFTNVQVIQRIIISHKCGQTLKKRNWLPEIPIKAGEYHYYSTKH